MRVIGGTYRSRRLRTLEGLDVRPTSDRLRETLFNILGTRVRDSRFLDLCAGSGAVGIEALSRGAREGVFVDRSRHAVSIIDANLKSLGIARQASVICRDALDAVKQLAAEAEPFDFIFLDPPYASGIYLPVLEEVALSALLSPGGVIVAEHRAKTPLPAECGDLKAYRVLKQGESALTFYTASVKS